MIPLFRLFRGGHIHFSKLTIFCYGVKTSRNGTHSETDEKIIWIWGNISRVSRVKNSTLGRVHLVSNILLSDFTAATKIKFTISLSFKALHNTHDNKNYQSIFY